MSCYPINNFHNKLVGLTRRSNGCLYLAGFIHHVIEVPQAQVIAVDVDVSSFKVYDFLQLGIFINLNDVINTTFPFLPRITAPKMKSFTLFETSMHVLKMN